MQCSLGQFQGGESFLCGVVFSCRFLPNRNRCFRGKNHLGFLPNSLCFTVRSRPPYSSSLHSTSLTGATSFLKPEDQQEGDEEDEEDDDDFGEEQEDVQVSEQERIPFMISYLVNSCGLSPESAARVLPPHKKDNAKAVIDCLKSYGISNDAVSQIVRRYPVLVLSNPVVLLPKIEFLRSIGASNSDIDIILTKNYMLLHRSLEGHSIPIYNKLKSILVSDEKVVKCMKRLTRRSLHYFSLYFEDNLSMLREIGISESALCCLVVTYPNLMGNRPDKFSQKVREVLDVGVDPSKFSIVHAIAVFSQLSRETREKKLQLYRSWCLSEKEIWSAFKKAPTFLLYSQKKINNTLDFLVNKMGYQPSDVANAPFIMNYSLERIIPRFSVVRALQLKGLIKGNASLTTVLAPSEENFLGMFVFKYEEEAPELLRIFRGDMNIWELGYGLEETWRSKDL